MACLPCYKDWISCGNTVILVTGTLEAGESYKWVLENKGAKYSGDVTTDGNGNFTILVSELPNGLLNPYAGMFELTVVADDAYQCNSEVWNDSAYCDSYTCIEFDVRNGEHVKNTLGCPCLEYINTEDGEFIILE